MATRQVSIISKWTPDGDISLVGHYDDVTRNVIDLTITKPINATPTLFVKDANTGATLYQETEPAGQTTIVHNEPQVTHYKVTINPDGLVIPFEFVFG